ncbi:MAG: hypothetical protein V1831_02240 [Candidatus Woesearchaeota archaeon]
MCKNCFGRCIASAIATWGFFALLLSLLSVRNALANAVWLTLLIFAAVYYCPVINPKLAECCAVKPKKKK